MDRIVFYAEEMNPEIVRNALSGVEVTVVYSQRRLIEALVDDPSLVGTVINVIDMPEWMPFLSSISQSFPLLPVLIVRPAGSVDCPEGFHCLDDDTSDSNLRESLDKLLGDPGRRDRRKHHRFSWPLRARIAGGTGTIHRIAEISAGGAYLVPAESEVAPGETCDLEILFQNFSMKAQCVILDPRHMSSKRSAGFGVRFDGLSDEASSFIDRIVQDAIIEILIDSTAQPEIPTIDEDEDLLSIGNEFALI